jgi:hypothetical protein
MLISSDQLNSSRIKASDGELGHIKDVYFDDQNWTVRFLVVDTSRWMPLSQKVLLSPISLLDFNKEDEELAVSMTMEKVKDSPKVEDQDTVSRGFEKQYYEYFGYGYYWTGMDLWGDYLYPGALTAPGTIVHTEIEQDDREKNNHLRSAQEVLEYDIHIDSADSGQLEDFIWDSYNWSLKYLVVDTGDWLPETKKVLVACKHIDSIRWDTKSVKLNISVAQIAQCAEYDPDNIPDHT